ncbi:site-2 protease family protein [Oceanobacillus halophilus]|uniref:Peptidase M50 domain-containing protein n=1 Tax=Oceanobacillus halophilus TaxID=930130 RepID=A0A495ACK7_9BACI|nr:site-2 protease family protein [Oceanobacillus halophilus]RKQ37709.1 hypothetical protein D8M06_02580 [Oceanobacillus halophilus]
MVMIKIVVFLIFFIAPISTLIHELGHAVAARLLRADFVSLFIGKGKRLVTFNIFQIQFVVNSFFILGGHTMSYKSPPYNMYESVYVTLFGPLLNGIVAFILSIFYSIQANIYIEIAIWFNLWLFFVNLIPIRLNERQTDGYIVYKMLKKY